MTTAKSPSMNWNRVQSTAHYQHPKTFTTYNHLAFGSKPASGIFRCIMDATFAFAYLDTIVVLSRSKNTMIIVKRTSKIQAIIQISQLNDVNTLR